MLQKTTFRSVYTDSPMVAETPFKKRRNKVRITWHDDVIKWKHFPRYWPFVRGIHRSPVNSPHKGLWRGALMFSLICVWISGWVNNREAGDLRRYRAHYDVIVMDCAGQINVNAFSASGLAHTIFLLKYTHGFLVLIMWLYYQLIMNSSDSLARILGTGAIVIVGLPQCQWRSHEGYGLTLCLLGDLNETLDK